VALLLAAWSALASLAGAATRRDALIASGERAVLATFAFVALASAGLWAALLTSDFSLRYVASFTSLNLPLLYKFAAFWAGPAGQWLFCALLLAACAALMVAASRRRVIAQWATGAAAVALLGVLVMVTLASSPFERLPLTPAEGRGLDPLLQAGWMALQPPSTYIGLAASVIPFAFAIGAIATRQFDDDWVRAVRPWTLLAWVFLTIGIVLGMRWSYLEPAWSAAWRRDSVQTGSLFPWIAHTTVLLWMRAFERGAALRTWNVIVVVAAVPLSVLAALVSRAGSAQSFEALAQSSTGAWVLGLGAAVTGAAAWLVFVRLRDVPSRPVTPPVQRDWRRYGMHVAGAGMSLVLVALIASAFRQQTATSLSAGQSFTTHDPWGNEWVFTSQGISMDHTRNREMQIIALKPARNGAAMAMIRSEKREYVDTFDRVRFDATTESGVLQTPLQDVYMVFVGAMPDGKAVVRIAFNPLVAWCWLGGAIVALGGLVAMWPRGDS
jgi:cytochrome c biogenesis factor